MNPIWSKTLQPGGKWSGIVGRGIRLKLTALQEGANVSMLLYHARDLTERYNMPDTLKAQHTAHLTRGHVLMSDNGRVLAGIVEDSVGWHDTISGYIYRSQVDSRYGPTTYQEKRNDWLRSGEDNFASELVRCGLGRRDLVPNVNWFTKVYCEESGRMRTAGNHAPAGSSVMLRMEMETLALCSNTPCPLDPSPDYPSVPVLLEAFDGKPLTAEEAAEDVCASRCPENARAYENTWDYYALLR